MKRYLIFGAIGPLIGGFLLLFVTTWTSGYWKHTDLGEIKKLFVVFAMTLQYAYLFGIVPALMLGAIDDILYHIKRIGWVVRVLIVGALGFVAAYMLYGSRGPDTGVVQIILYGMVGWVPATLASLLSHRFAEEHRPAVSA
ncbi:DUF5413 family protein [Bradyrhizobium lablabi]|uniref:DUF5413 family protein n=1 Tax=Bradyrhizobium lablabi TaxID=722472 RepID=UPI001BAC2F94|nr:DUF5413 family protein [Bradyrhizobium lablabi]MBR1124083.1 DUF5413 family protein [Bradyrhizobium lablabi]